MDWKITIVSFFAVIATICTIPYISIEDDDIDLTQTTNVVQVVTV